MLNDVIGDLLPSAFAVALSPIPIIAVVVVLGSPRARSAGSAFALGWIGGLLAVSVIVAAVLFYLIDAQRAAHPLEAIRRFMSDNNAVIMMMRSAPPRGQAPRRRAYRPLTPEEGVGPLGSVAKRLR